ncbi:hypothetical protein SI65_04941 [Aspergillus cristatus]|uniref:PhoD-like phosphatase metallophosphatase domain-containing protein n=1 Tax=Aspergillus cristatus TaxID=573508 RepID=A0A1E3BG49_ASPCR|nr:hypothetical protein SI65_04941 [Aspergillus cristatus]
MSLQSIAAIISSFLLRFAAFVFLRWIPGRHFPPIVFTSLVVYFSAWPALTKQKSSRRPDSKHDDRKFKQSAAASSGGSVLKTLLTGLPSPRLPRTSRLTALINIVLTLFTLDFLLRGLVLYSGEDLTLSRVGYVSPTTASLLIREPDPAQLPLTVSYQAVEEDLQSKWIEEGIIYKLDNTTDFTTSVVLKGLKPSSQYRYALSNNRTGTFSTAPLPGTESAHALTFLTSSCMKPNFPYNPLSHPLRFPGVEQVSETISKLLFRPAFMLFLGDFIYIDVPMRFGSSISHYRSEYRRVYSSPSWNISPETPVIDLPWLHTLDDHEIENDWSHGNTTAPYPAAAEPYIHYHVSVNPPIPPTPFAKPEDTTYFSFIHGPASFFVLDSRTYRSEPAQINSTILGSAQLQSLLAYLARPEPAEVRWKIIASSVPFTKNWHIGTTDTWGGFLNERRTVFEAMWRAERELGVRIVLLSGDRHEFATTRFPDPSLGFDTEDLEPNTAGEGVHEFTVGPLSMFYLPVRSYWQSDREDVTVKYIPDGNVKYGLIDIRNGEEPVDTHSGTPVLVPSSVLTYSLYVDGAVVWEYRLSVPLPEKQGRLPAGSTAKHPRLPPGKVVRDERQAEGWDVRVKDVIGRLEEMVGLVRRSVVEWYYEAVEGARRAERVD